MGRAPTGVWVRADTAPAPAHMVALAPLAFRFRLRPPHLTHVAAGTIRMSHGFRRMHMSRRALRGSPLWVDIHYYTFPQCIAGRRPPHCGGWVARHLSFSWSWCLVRGDTPE